MHLSRQWTLLSIFKRLLLLPSDADGGHASNSLLVSCKALSLPECHSRDAGYACPAGLHSFTSSLEKREVNYIDGSLPCESLLNKWPSTVLGSIIVWLAWALYRYKENRGSYYH